MGKEGFGMCITLERPSSFGLHDERYKGLIVEVDDPQAAVALIQSAL
jgi:hypothetical protein